MPDSMPVFAFLKLPFCQILFSEELCFFSFLTYDLFKEFIVFACLLLSHGATPKFFDVNTPEYGPSVAVARTQIRSKHTHRFVTWLPISRAKDVPDVLTTLLACITGVYLAEREARDIEGEARGKRERNALRPRCLAPRARLNKRLLCRLRHHTPCFKTLMHMATTKIWLRLITVINIKVCYFVSPGYFKLLCLLYLYYARIYF